jgi:hypothetical protein
MIYDYIDIFSQQSQQERTIDITAYIFPQDIHGQSRDEREPGDWGFDSPGAPVDGAAAR